MKTTKEIQEWLLENATDEYGNVVLNGIEFSGDLIIKNCKVEGNYNSYSNEVEGNYNSYSNKVEGNYNSYFNEVEGNYNSYFNKVQGNYNINSNKVEGNYDSYSNKVEGNYDSYFNKVEGNYNSYSNKVEGNYDSYFNKVEGNYDSSYNKVESQQFYDKYAIYNGKHYEVDLTDDYYLMIVKSQTRNGITIIEGVNLDGRTIYLYKNQFVGYHGITKQEAKEGFKRKLKGFEANKELLEEIKEKGFITREDYHQLTGACFPGIQAFAERLGKPNDNQLTLQELKELLNPNDYGYEYIKKWGLLNE